MKTDNPLLTVIKPIEEIYSIQLHSYRCTTVVTCSQLATVTVLAIKSSLHKPYINRNLIYSAISNFNLKKFTFMTGFVVHGHIRDK